MAMKVLIVSYIKGSASSKPDAELAMGLQRQGVEITVMIPEKSVLTEEFIQAGIRVIPFHPVKKLSFKAIRLIRKEIREKKIQIVHLLNSKAIFFGTMASLGLPVKVIAYRGAVGLHWYDPTAWLSYLHPRIDFIVCNSYYVQQHVQQQLLFRPKKAVMIHKGMDLSWFRNVIPAKREVLGIPAGAIVAGCVANVRRIKGVPYLLEATCHLNPELPLHILLIGIGMKSEVIRKLILSSPFKDRIHIMGFRPDVYELIAACDIYIQPSLSESLSRSVMEAMSMGVPCIVSDVGGLAELVEDNKSGLLVEKGDPFAIARAIERMADHPELRKQFAEEGLTRMKEIFSVENMVTQTRMLYERILS
jgi:L-malate glycosyltransferase